MNRRNLLGVPAAFILLLLGLSLTAATARVIDLAPPARPGPEGILEFPGIAGGPDPFGYTYADSGEQGGPFFDWLDITDGTVLDLPANGAVVITLPFTFTLYGLPSRHVTVSNEGLLLLGARDVGDMSENEPLSTTVLTGLIAPFWDDFDFRLAGTYYKTLGAAPNRRFVIEWYDRPHWPVESGLGTVTFEVILYEGTEDVKLQYEDTDFGNPPWDDGASATVGIRGSGSNYLQYAYDQPVLHPGMAICFRYPGSPPCDELLPPRIGVSPAEISATQLAGEVTTHTLTIANTGGDDLGFVLQEIPPSHHSMVSSVDWLGEWPGSGTITGGSSLDVTVVFTAPLEVYGTYSATLGIASDDPSVPLLTLPLTMTVVLPPSLSIAKRPSAGRILAGSLLTYSLSVSNTGGPVSGASVSDTLPPATRLAWIDGGGLLVGNDIIWNGLHLPQNARQVLSYAITVTCVPTGTEIVNRNYQAVAPGWPPPVQGRPVTVTAVADGVTAGFDVPELIVRREPVTFTNLSLAATAYLWRFGDGLTSTLPSPAHTYAEPGPYTAVLTASSLCSTDAYSQVLSVEDFALVIAPRQATGRAAPGQEVVYTLSLSNAGTLSDTFSLALGDHVWHTSLSTEEVGPLAAGSATAFQVLVSVPSDAHPGDLDRAAVQAVSSVDPRRPPVQAISLLTTAAGPYALYLPLVLR